MAHFAVRRHRRPIRVAGGNLVAARALLLLGAEMINEDVELCVESCAIYDRDVAFVRVVRRRLEARLNASRFGRLPADRCLLQVPPPPHHHCKRCKYGALCVRT